MVFEAGMICTQSLTSASPSIFTKEAFQMVQGMYNATLDCDKLWPQEDTEMTGVCHMILLDFGVRESSFFFHWFLSFHHQFSEKNIPVNMLGITETD